MCNCLKQQLFDLEYNKSNVFNLENHKFENFLSTVYSDKVDNEKYGSDIFRMYLMFGFEYRQGGPWNEKGIESMSKYFGRIERLIDFVNEFKTKN